MLTFILISLIFLLAGLIQGLSGFGSALLAMPLLALFIDVKTAVPLCVLHGLLISIYLSIQLKDYIDWKEVFPLAAGSMPGIYMGVTFLINVNSDIVKLLLGLLLVLYSAFTLYSHPVPVKMRRIWAYAAGFASGFIGSAFSTGGPPAIIYATLTGWSKNRMKATITGFFLIVAAITSAVYIASGLADIVVLKYFSVSAVFVLIGVYSGSRLYNKISRRGYIKIILIILVLLGLMMIISALYR